MQTEWFDIIYAFDVVGARACAWIWMYGMHMWPPSISSSLAIAKLDFDHVGRYDGPITFTLRIPHNEVVCRQLKILIGWCHSMEHLAINMSRRVMALDAKLNGIHARWNQFVFTGAAEPPFFAALKRFVSIESHGWHLFNLCADGEVMCGFLIKMVGSFPSGCWR